MSKMTEEQLIRSLAAVMTVTESLISQLGEIAAVYDQMPDGIKYKIAESQIRSKIEILK